MLDPNSRFSSQEVAQRLPGCCLFCKTSEGPFVDPKLSLPIYGAVYICINNCLRQLVDEFLPSTTPEPVVEIIDVGEEVAAILADYRVSLIDSLDRLSSFLPALESADAVDGAGAEQVDDEEFKLAIGNPEGEPDAFSVKGPDGISSDLRDDAPAGGSGGKSS